MRLIESSQANALANPRLTQPFLKLKGLRFPTTREVQAAFVEIQKDTTQELNFLDTLFPETDTLATEIEMYVTRHDANGYVGMTFPHALETEIRTFDRGAKMDIAKASWSPIHFKEGKAWGESEMLQLGKLIPEVQTSQIDADISEYMVMAAKRRRARKQHMKWQVLRTGKVTIDRTTPDNPDKIKWVIDYGVTDIELDMPVKIDAVGADGRSLLDPVEWITNINRAAKFTGKKIVKMYVNSNFVEYLTDNTFIRTGIDYERGLQTTQAVPNPRYVYRAAALDYFKRFTGIEIEFNDQTYEDETSQQHYWIPDGEALLLYGNTGPVGNFVHTAHIAPSDADGTIKISTGEYLYAVNRTKEVKPRFDIVSGFSGLPQLNGYDPITFEYDRFKWVQFASNTVQNPALPKRPQIGGPIA